jgi:SAM-dependent methyltransferase
MQPDDWSHGYITDQLYTDGFYRELAPSWLNYVAAVNGCHPRPIDGEFTYLELGCGLGQTTNVLAACYPKARFYGVDFNPAHIDSARIFARSTGIENVTFLERAFDELRESDVPECDFVGIHGIYSWVSPEVQASIRRVLRRHLKPGGLAYVSYNALPGWAAPAPNQKLLYEFSEATTGLSTDRVGRAMSQAKALLDLKVGFHALHEAASKHLTGLGERPAAYLVHEYLNASWQPFYSTDVADAMAEAKLAFCGSSTLVENHLEMVANDVAAKFLMEQPTQRLQQLVQDFILNQRFRRDVFARGHAHLAPAVIQQNLRQTCLFAPRSLTDKDASARIPRGEVKFDKNTYPGVRAILTRGSMSLQDILVRIRAETSLTGEMDKMIQMMVACNHLMPAASAFVPAPLPAQPSRWTIPSTINRAILASAVQTSSRRFLASESLGNGLALESGDAIGLNFLIRGEGSKAPTRKEIEAALIKEYTARGIKAKPIAGKTETVEEAIRRLGVDQAKRLFDEVLPVLWRSGIITCE